MKGSLRSRLALLLVLANLPAAALAIGATLKSREDETHRAQNGIVQRAELIATRAGLTLGVAEGVADTLSADSDVAEGGPACGEYLREALSRRPEYVGIVIAGHDGNPLCSAGEVPLSSGNKTSLTRAITTTQDVGEAVFLPEEISPRDPAVLLSRAFVAPTGERRAVGLALKRDIFDAIFLPSPPDSSEKGALALIRSGGAVVSEFGKTDASPPWSPSNPLPVGKPGDPPTGLTMANSAGIDFHYAVAPVKGTTSSVVLATPLSAVADLDWLPFIAAVAAPLLMLLLGIVAVFSGVDHLVLRWIARLRTVTSSYARGDYSPRVAHIGGAPRELYELGAGIHDMAVRVQERSSALEAAVEGKNALLRELHHRVKNNFQMIASLLALQRRELPTRLRTLLRVPEDRVLAMAAAYKASYSTGEIGKVSLIDLLRDVAAQLRQSFGSAAPVVQIASPDAPVWLDLDQAVPLGLLTSEILTAALERVDADRFPVEIRIVRRDPGTVHVEIASEGVGDVVPSTGLAARLVTAYRAQLSAEVLTPDGSTVVIAMPLGGDSHGHPGRVELGS